MYIKIAHITDLHLDEALPSENGIQTRNRFKRILEDIKSENIEKIICTGDIGENDGVNYFFDELETTPLSITLGNHDTFNEILKYFSKGIRYDSKKIYYSELKDFYKFIYLDSSEGILDEQQLKWLKKELVTKRSILIFMHHPIIGLNLKVDKIGRLKNRNIILDLLETTPNSITLFCGHYHMENYSIRKNVKQYITPATSFQIQKSKTEIKIDTNTFGYRIIEVEKGALSSKVKMFGNAD